MIEPDPTLADKLIELLNDLIQDPAIRKDIQELLETRISVSDQTVSHPTLQTAGTTEQPTLGVLGLLNGLCGTYKDGPKQGWGYISAEYEIPPCRGTEELTRFVRTPYSI